MRIVVVEQLTKITQIMIVEKDSPGHVDISSIVSMAYGSVGV